MGFWTKIFGGKSATPELRTLANSGKPAEKVKRVLPHELKAVSRVRQDIKSWNVALATAQAEEPMNYALQLLYDEIMLDALLTSQIENRKNQVFSIDFVLRKPNGEEDEEQTAILRKLPAYRHLSNAALDSIYYGYNLVEQRLVKKDDGGFGIEVDVLPRTNVVPQLGRFFQDYSDPAKFVNYREIPEYGTYVLEFNTGGLGLLNKAVSHVLFKRFAQSCWSELCEIYGIPPRVMKTNTQDPAMMSRAESMMRDMGAAAWFIIDDTENFDWAESTATNGDVYKNLINLCSNEISLLISGAIIGQDTVNGNRSKEESSQNVLWENVKSDLAMLEEKHNAVTIPALIKLGFLKPGNTFEYVPAADIEQLWKFTSGAIQYYKVDTEWFKKTFGVEITEERNLEQPQAQKEKKQTLTVEELFD